MKIAIVIGHSEVSKGAIAVDGVQEYTHNKVVARQLQAELAKMKHTAVVYHRANMPYTQAMAELIGRVNGWGAECVLSLHFNSSNSPMANGTECLHWPGSTRGAQLAAGVAGAVAGVLGTTERGARPQAASWAGAPLYILRDTVAPAIISESHFGSNARDHAAYIDGVAGGKLASAMAGAVDFWAKRRSSGQ